MESTFVISQDQLDQLLDRILGDGQRLVAPVRQGSRLVLAPVDSPAEIAREDGLTANTAKELLFPRTEAILEFSHPPGPATELELSDLAPAAVPTVLFGVRPCDGVAIARLRQVFADDRPDRFFLRRLENTTVITIACNQPQPSCFCTAVGYGPAVTEGSDLMLSELGDGRLLAAVNSHRGAALVAPRRNRAGVADHGDLFAAHQAAVAPEKPDQTASLVDLAPVLRDAFSDPRWDKLGLACLGCGACAYCCPTCHCFDLIDDGELSRGSRLRIWDSCAFATFTVHASGHNPRPSQALRYRQRIMHKFSYYPQRHGKLMCVGCGRCIAACPVGQDIYQAALGFAGG